MKRTVILRALSGIPLGIALETVISIFISAVWAGGYYVPYEPTLEQVMGSELGAMVMQTALCALLGAAFGGLSVIWELDAWSIARQTGAYFLGASIAMLPIAYFNCWMEHTLAGFLEYFVLFAAIFAVIWLILHAKHRRDVRAINKKLEGK